MGCCCFLFRHPGAGEDSQFSALRPEPAHVVLERSARAHEEAGTRFCDADFDPAELVKNLGPLSVEEVLAGAARPGRRVEISWVRLSEFCQGPEVVPDEVSAWDMQQGTFPDCHLIVAASMLATKADNLRRLFKPQHITAHGAYSVRFWRAGKFMDVVVDDRVPCAKGTQQPLFARSRSGHAWPLILEKAYAKFYGSYIAINGGNIAESMYDLSGCPVESINLRKGSLLPDIESGAFYHELAARRAEGCPMTGGTPKTEDGRMHFHTANGLVAGHAYGILGFHWIEWMGREELLIRLYNPWGKKGGLWWKGDWGAASPQWTPELREAVGYREDEEGVFFISARDFFANFDTVNVCHTEVHSLPVDLTFQGEFAPPNAGGCAQYVSWRHNDVYSVLLRSPARIHLVVANDEQRGKVRAGTISYNQVGFTVVSAPGDAAPSPSVLVAGNYDVHFKTTFWNKREVYGYVDLPASAKPYLVVVSTYYPRQFGSYWATFKSSAADTEVTRVACRGDAWGLCQLPAVHGEWRGRAAAGLEALCHNPQYRLDVGEDCECDLFLCQECQAGGPASSLPQPPTPLQRMLRAADGLRSASVPRHGRPLSRHPGARSRSAGTTQGAAAQLGSWVGRWPVALVVFRRCGGIAACSGTQGMVYPDRWPPRCKPQTEIGVRLRLSAADSPYCVVPTTQCEGEESAFTISVLSTSPAVTLTAAPRCAAAHSAAAGRPPPQARPPALHHAPPAQSRRGRGSLSSVRR